MFFYRFYALFHFIVYSSYDYDSNSTLKKAFVINKSELGSFK